MVDIMMILKEKGDMFMYVFKNAFRNIVRAKGRSILIFCLVLVIAISSCVALSIKTSADEAKDVAYSNMKVTAQIGFDRNSMMVDKRDPEAMQEMMEMMSNTLSQEKLELYATSENVESYYYSSQTALNSLEDGIEPYSLDNGFMKPNKGGVTGGSMLNKSSGDFTVVGYNSHDAMTNFIDGTLTISEGSIFDENNTNNLAVISMELAVLNDLEVGDTIELVNPSKEDELIEMIISGIFTCESTDAYSNEIYTSYDSLEKIYANSDEVAETVINDMTEIETSTALQNRIDSTYVFSTPEEFEAFKSDVETMGLDTSVYTVTSTDVGSFNKSMVPLDNLSNFTMMFFVVVLIIGSIILVIFNLFIIRERKYEIGVLSAIGMQKHKIAIQFLSEVMVITLMAVAVGTGIGATVSAPIGDVLLTSQVESIESESNDINANFGGGFKGERPKPGMKEEMSLDVDYIDTMQTSTDFNVITQLMGIGILLALLSSSVAIISILRYEPLQILSER